MSEPDAVLSFAGADPDRLEAAVNAALLRRTELADELRKGAAESVGTEPTATATARRFQTLLELGYLVASADGFADEERASLAHLLESVTDHAIDQQVLDDHFQDLNQGVAMLGREHRLLASAAALEDVHSAEEAVSLVALIALADGVLAQPEYEVIEALGKHAGLDAGRVKALVDEAGAQVKEALG